MHTTTARTVRYNGHQRRWLSFLGALLYVLSAIALPSLHVGFHRADHQHRGGGLQLLHGVLAAHPHQHLGAPSHSASSYRRADDEHPAAREETDAPVALPASSTALAQFDAQVDPAAPFLTADSVRDGRPPQTSLTAAPVSPPLPARDPAHGDGSLVHFASAFLPSAAVATAPLVGPLLALLRYFQPVDRALDSSLVVTKEARGPPSLIAV